ncbi:hypothetical protein NliqN6_0234 [Naganishia liquefaciens]|uniref:Zn(2)-C6 fungal-type domain-containing protein n=1 Tax=Naganishia liquefaciens TaxID=104408 RepID=A0A8H3YD16_9TREE|nr:hypothetical protein NliqN6_0234 [Naganishia liquefaciens]
MEGQGDSSPRKGYTAGSTSGVKSLAPRNRSRSFSPQHHQDDLGRHVRYQALNRRQSATPPDVDPSLTLDGRRSAATSPHEPSAGHSTSSTRQSGEPSGSRHQGTSSAARPYLSNLSSACVVWQTEIQEHGKSQPSADECKEGINVAVDKTRMNGSDCHRTSEGPRNKVPSPSYTFPANPPDLKRTTSNNQSVSFSQTSSSVALSHAATSLELTSKGKKRKRLAKACSACHKNKRRCDGFAPCSNCEFSSRQCVYLNSKGEVIPPPKTREGSVSGASGAVGFEMEASDVQSVSHRQTERGSIAGFMIPRSERSLKPVDADTFKRPLPPGSFGGHSDARSRDLRRMSQGTMSSVYSERPAPHAIPVPPIHVDAVPPPDFAGRHLDLPRRDSMVDGTADSLAGPSSLHAGSARRFSKPSFSYTSQPRSSLLQVVDRTSQPEKLPLNAKLLAVERQAAFVEELVHTFFARLHPYQLMFHQPTFQYRRYLNLVPSALLNMMYALAIRFIDPVTLHDALVAEHATTAEIDLPLFLAGEVFVHEAKQAIDAWLKQKSAAMRRASWSANSIPTWEDLEMAMAITLCGFYEKAMTKMADAAQYFDNAIDQLRQNLSISASQTINETHPDVITLRRCTERTLWMLYLADVSSGIHIRPRQLLDYQMSNIALPTNEAEFSWHGGCRSPSETRELAFGVDALNLPGAVIPNADISEFGHLIRSASILYKIMALFGQASHDRVQTSKRAAALEAELRSWASCLPENLQFNDRNFVLNVKKLGSTIPSIATCGFCFALMHSIAESSQFYLQSIAAIAGDIDHSITATRQSQAVDNMTVVIDTIGDVGRQSPEAFVILDIVSTWAAHTAGTLPSGRPPSLATQRNEMRLEQWWADLSHSWGLRRQSTAIHRPGNVPPSILSSHSTASLSQRHSDSSRDQAEVEAAQSSRYDSRFGRSSASPYPLPHRASHDGYMGDGRMPHGRNTYARDGEDGDPHALKKRRLSGGPIRRPFDEEQPMGPPSKAAAPHPHSGLAALLTAAEHRGT